MKYRKTINTFPSICVIDTNTLIDFSVGGLLAQLFRLPFKLATPDVIFEDEILHKLSKLDGKNLLKLGLQERELPGTDVLEVSRLRQIYSQCGANDLFCLQLAISSNATLLTGNKHLRRAAEREKVPVHGTLWILKSMEKLKLVKPSRLAKGLQRMRKAGRYLPEQGCNDLLKKWHRSKK